MKINEIIAMGGRYEKKNYKRLNKLEKLII